MTGCYYPHETAYAPVFDINSLLAEQKHREKAVIETSHIIVPQPFLTSIQWGWPLQSPTHYQAHDKGLDLAGVVGESIFASAAGKVVYCGNGLKGYGNLIIIRHNNSYLSAYAHNQSVFVTEDQWVQKGQKIATMGTTIPNRAILHFEIRYNGKAINPLSVLKQPKSPI